MKNGVLDSERITLEEFRKYMFYPIYPIGELADLQGRPMAESFPFWRRNGLMPFIPKGSWNVEISFAQVIWLRMLDHLRALGYGVKDTAALCDRLFKDAYQEDLPKKRIKYHVDRFKKMELTGTLSPDDKELLYRLEQMLRDSALLYGLKIEFNFLTDLIVWCIENNIEAGLLIFPEGQVVKRQGESLYPMGEVLSDPDSPHIYLSIYYFLKEFIQSDEMKLIHVPGILTENEKKVLMALREKNIHELQVKLLDGEIIRIDSKTIRTVSGDTAKKIRLAIGMGRYEEVTLSTRDAQTITFKKTKKKILSGKPGR